MVVKQYIPGGEYQQLFNSLIGELKGITIFCGNEKKLRFFYDSHKFQNYSTDTYSLNEEILGYHLKALRKREGTVENITQMDTWHKIYPYRYICI